MFSARTNQSKAQILACLNPCFSGSYVLCLLSFELCCSIVGVLILVLVEVMFSGATHSAIIVDDVRA